jgi:hypothetical protein
LIHVPRWFAVLLCVALLPFGNGALGAQTIGVSGNPALLRVSSAVAGSEPIAVSNGTTTYTVVTLTPNRLYKVTAQIDAAMPTGLTLTATFNAPPGATSLGAIALDLTARDVVTAIPKNTNSTQGITYQLSATVLAGVVPSTSRNITLTIVRVP